MRKPGHCKEIKPGTFFISKIFSISINNYINKFNAFYNTKIIYGIIYAQLKKELRSRNIQRDVQNPAKHFR